MSEDSWGFAPPPYRPADAWVQLKRALRELGLTERQGGLELGGRKALECEVGEQQLQIRLAKRLSVRTPDWELRTLKNHADQRKLLDEVRQRLARWRDEAEG
ncbi:hypothetical protein HNQ51_001877 [Inhella inkyongensis]|uniref:Uncharacterized protein n=1 Tax=Inhella inkyongensis TaxID=392593 RepID=A0A840S4C5_9BURK|nr:hypothetical protein [Inhella inkyongensis]MBB5204563.1 hypothetical protein [Inhella inkyongensis]